ncbi:ATP-grasp domain-containing protein [Streptomyces sp. NPDC001834]|uniref:ATP-grasp domain-containing protein n=1 Tax=Streptomyces sp. NPDC001834 TaxID=3364616 RepID=UPI0036B7D06A
MPTASPPHAVLVGGMGWTGAQVVTAARAHGCRLSLIQERAQITEHHRAHTTRVIGVPDLADTGTVIREVKEIHDQDPVDYVFSVTEFGLVPAAATADALGIGTPVPPNVAAMLRSKSRMRELLRGEADFEVASHRCSAYEDVVAAARSVGYPVIVKPDDAWGSLGVRRVDDEAGLRAAFEESDDIGCAVLVEEYLDGPEFSVEVFSHAGRHHVLAVTRKVKLSNFVETGHVVPGASPADAAAIADRVTRFLDVVGLRDGNSHTEVILTASGPRIVESHNRPGGDSIPYLVHLATGINLAELAVAVPLGLMDVPRAVEPATGAAIHFWVGDPGTVTDVPQLSDTAREQCVDVTFTARPGQRIGEVLHSFDRLGYVITRGATGDDAFARAHGIVTSHPFAIAPASFDERESDRLDRVRRYARGG